MNCFISLFFVSVQILCAFVLMIIHVYVSNCKLVCLYVSNDVGMWSQKQFQTQNHNQNPNCISNSLYFLSLFFSVNLSFFEITSFCESSHVLVRVSRDVCICVGMHCLRICIVSGSFKCFLVRFSMCLLIYIVNELIGDMYL